MYVELYRGRIANPFSQIPAVFENLQIPSVFERRDLQIPAGICQIPVLPKYRRDLAFWRTLYRLLTTYVHAHSPPVRLVDWDQGGLGPVDWWPVRTDDNPVPVLDRNPTVPATEALALDGRVP